MQQLDGNVWRAYVWADYEDGAHKHDFTLWLSERGSRWKALKDCDEWLTAAEAMKTKLAGRHGRATQVAEK